MNSAEKIRIEYAVQRYDTHLDLRGVDRHQRKGLRADLRANLLEAAQRVGVSEALAGIGSPKQLAFDTVEPDDTRARWSLGLVWGAVTHDVRPFYDRVGAAIEKVIRHGEELLARHSQPTTEVAIG